jgi:hypothetical protein
MLIIELENYSNHLASILQYFKQEADQMKRGAQVPLDALSDYMSQFGMSVNPDVIKSMIEKDPVIQNLVKSFDGDQITIDTIVEPGSDGSDIKGTDQVSKMAKRALKKRS